MGAFVKRPKPPAAPDDPQGGNTADVPTDAGTGGPTKAVQPNKEADVPSTDLTGDLIPGTGSASWATPDAIERMSIEVANETGAGQSSAENLAKWARDITANNWTKEQARDEMVKKALEPDTSARGGGYLDAANAYGGLFGNGGLSGFLGSSMVPTDAGAFETLQQRIKDILGGGGGLDSRALSAGAGSPSGTPGGGSSSATPVGSPASPAAVNAVPTPTGPAPTYMPGPNPYAPDALNDSAKSRDTQILGDLVNRVGVGQNNVANTVANQSPTTIPDRAADAITGLFGLTPILKAGNYLQKFNKPGDIIFGNPPGGPQGPTDPNLRPMSDEEKSRNAQIAAQLLANNEANGGI